MKTSYAGWVVAGVLLVLIFAVGAMQQQGQVGRWQVVVGEWEGKSQAVMVDTVTGWTYWRGTGPVGWNPVPSPRPRDGDR